MTKSKIAALVVAAVYILLSITQNWMRLENMLIFLVFPLSIIFFAEKLSSYIGPVMLSGRITKITRESPPKMVEFVGWVILLLPVLVYFLISQIR